MEMEWLTAKKTIGGLKSKRRKSKDHLNFPKLLFKKLESDLIAMYF
jgi:hypothetical protein